jgi:sulfatase maturation enzyme AslB (radical SAM superfamily)
VNTSHVVHAWGKILKGQAPTLSIEVTRECPLRCPGCYAYDEGHLGGGGVTLRTLSDFKGQALIDGVLEVVDRIKPLHVSLVGGDPLVRYRELEVMVPEILKRGTHVQVVTSAFREIPKGWAELKNLNVVVSIDGLPAEHDVRRTPATYERILKSIAASKITVHCTITGQMMKRPGYLEDFLRFWDARPEVRKIWFSMFTPQIGDVMPEILTAEEKSQAVEELIALRSQFPKLDMPEMLLRQFLKPPHSPDECVFAQTTQTVSADLRTQITPCQLGGTPDCSQCGCVASMVLGAVADYKLAGFIPVGAIFKASAKIGKLRAKPQMPPPPPKDFVVLGKGAGS